MDGDYSNATILEARIALIVAASVLLAFLAFFLVCHVISLSTLRPGEIYKKNNRWRLYLFLMTTTASVGGSMLLSSVIMDWRLAPGSCELFMSFLTMVFVNIRQFAGLVLYSRAAIVHEGLRMKQSNLLIFREFLWFSMTIGVWLVFGWSYWINYAGKVVPEEGICVLYSKFPVVILVFAVLDALMSLGMMLLFIMPLVSHTREMVAINAHGNVSDKLKKIIKYNSSLLMVLTTMDALGLITMATLLFIADGTAAGAMQDHLQLWALFGPTTSVLTSSIGLHSLTWSWIPRGVRVLFVRSEFSLNDLNAVSAVQHHENARQADVIYLGNIHADSNAIETQIQLRHYAVPFDTLNGKIFGLRFAKWVASSYRTNRWTWRITIFGVMATLSVLGVLILIGILPAWLSWFCLAVMVFTQATDNNYSISTLRLLLKRFGPAIRLLVSFMAMITLFDVVGWDERCGMIATMFLGMQYAYFTDALVRESREVFLYDIYLLSPIIPFWTLILLQGDFIAGRHNTILVFTTVQRYEYSVYLAARDLVFLLCLLSLKDMINVARGKGRDWFLFLNGDVAIRVVGLGEGKKNRNAATVATHERDTPTSPDGSVDRSARTQLGERFGLPRISSLDRKSGRVTDPSVGSAHNDHSSVNDERDKHVHPKVMMNVIELRERDSLVVRIFGLETGARVMYIYTEPWFRLLNEWLLGFPLALFTCGVLPGFIDVRFSYLLLLGIVPFLRNFGLKSANLLGLLMFRFDFLLEATIVYGAIIICMVTYLEREKACFAVYCLLFWLDLRTNDARCVFFHTGTRRGRRLSPFERFLFRLASLQVALAFIVLPVLLIIGVTLHADYSMGFKFVQNGRSYPDDLDWVFLYQTSTTATSLQCWKLICDAYSDLYHRGRGVHLRYIRAPVAPKFVDTAPERPEGPNSFVGPRSKVKRNHGSVGDVFSATYREPSDNELDQVAAHGGDTVTGTTTVLDVSTMAKRCLEEAPSSSA